MLLQTTNLTGGYGSETIVHDVSFAVQPGEFIGIIGPNGCGKSTLLKLLTRVLPSQNGSVSYRQADIASYKLKELYKELAVVTQEALINFSFSVWEIVLMGRIPHLKRLQQETKHDFEVAEKALELTGCLHLKNRMIDQLSTGERQRVLIAKALAQEPKLLLLDEPTSHLDIGHQIHILDLLKKLNEEQKLTIITVLHDLNCASEYCQRLILMDKGKIVQDGLPGEVLTYPNIEQVYKTVVVINPNPVSGKPNLSLIPKSYL